MENQENSGVNTVLIVIVLLVVVGVIVWLFAGRGPAVVDTPQDNKTLDIQVDIPDAGGAPTPTPTPTPTN